MKENIAIFTNPVSGQGKANNDALALQHCLERQGVQVHHQVTSFKGDGEAVARKCVRDGVRGIIVCGGDGTINEVVNGIKIGIPTNSSVPALSFFPSGRCNNFCKALGVPNDVTKVTDGILKGRETQLDLGKIGNRYFVTVAALGLDSKVAEYVDQGRTPGFLRGTASYIYGLLATIPSFKFPIVQLKADFGTFQGPVLLVAVGNTSAYGGGFIITPGATPDDGLLKVCVIRKLSKPAVLKLLPNVFSGSHIWDPRASLQSAKKLTIETQDPIWVWADGERVELTPVTIEIAASTLSVKLPPV